MTVVLAAHHRCTVVIASCASGHARGRSQIQTRLAETKRMYWPEELSCKARGVSEASRLTAILLFHAETMPSSCKPRCDRSRASCSDNRCETAMLELRTVQPRVNIQRRGEGKLWIVMSVVFVRARSTPRSHRSCLSLTMISLSRQELLERRCIIPCRRDVKIKASNGSSHISSRQ